MLLLATLPTLGRLAAQGSPSSHAMDMHHGHAMPATQEQGRHPQPPAQQHVEDCAYCVVLSGFISGVVPLFSLAPAPPHRLAVWRSMAIRPLDPRLAGLGARGPPVGA